MNITEIFAQHRILTIGLSVLLALTVLVGLFMSTKKVSPVGWGFFGAYNTESGLALGGNDAISYREGEPRLGSADHQSEWSGVTWQFATAANKARFDAAPEKYAPANGGFCSFAASKGFTANSNPGVWHIEGDRLFVFDSQGMKEKFMAQADVNIAISQKNWATR
jgi:YHS domain-containing protein